MKKKFTLQATKKVIPDGEGFNALPIAFVYPPPCPPHLLSCGKVNGEGDRHLLLHASAGEVGRGLVMLIMDR